jgi:hypothetical protein
MTNTRGQQTMLKYVSNESYNKLVAALEARQKLLASHRAEKETSTYKSLNLAGKLAVGDRHKAEWEAACAVVESAK